MNKNQYNDIKSRLIKASGGKLNSGDVERIKQGNLSSLSSLLSTEEKKTLLRLLKDKSAQKKIMEDPAIRNIINGKK